MKKNLLITSIIALATMSLVGCGSSEDETDSGYSTWEEAKAHRTPVNLLLDASNVYGAFTKGTDEDAVKDAVEKKFWEDTKNAINLKIEYLDHTNFSQKFNGMAASGEWDGAVSYIGQAGMDDTILPNNYHLDISKQLKSYGKNIKEKLKSSSLESVTNLSKQVVGIPSENITKQKAVLVRKDYMTKVGYTESKEEAEASGGTLKWCRTINDFDTMVRKMKTDLSSHLKTLLGDPSAELTPLSGNNYDLEFTLLTGAYDCFGYQYRDVNYNADGTFKEVVPGWISENYGSVLKQEYLWDKDGIWDSDSGISQSKRISDLTTGKTAVYFADPTITNIIGVYRQIKDSMIDPDAEFTLLPPLEAVDGSGNPIEGSGAFAEVSENTDCLIINKKSDKAKLIIQYIDWMYKEKDNYELCAYGIKGKHWKDSSIDGYYEYTDEKYMNKKPYSGAFILVHNDSISAKLPLQYTETEREWIKETRSYNTMKNPTDGMLFVGATATASSGYRTAEADIYRYAQTVWNGSTDPDGTFSAACSKYREDASEYLEWLNNQYLAYIQKRGS